MSFSPNRLRNRSCAVAYVWLLCSLVACGGEPAGPSDAERAPADPVAPDAGPPSGQQGGRGVAAEPPSATGTDSRGDGLVAQIETPAGLALSIVTTRCDAACAELVVVARGGNPPYSFAWQDGQTAPARTYCPSADGAFSVTVQDTASLSGEFRYEGGRATAQVYADVVSCPVPDGARPELSCDEAVEPLQLVQRTMNDLTFSLMNTNGALTDYELVDGLGAPLTLVREAHVIVDRASCSALPLAGDAAGTLPTGWDNYLIVEYRPSPGAAVEKRWYYGPAATIRHQPSGQVLSSPLAPTVSGFALDPIVPNPLPFGYAALELDLMDELPQGAGRFELSLYAVDSGAFGSTSAIWVLPR